MLLDARRYDEAARAASEALASDPFDVEAQLLRARANLRLERHREALQDAEAVLANEPSQIQAHAVRAGSLLGLERGEEALAAAIETTRLAPSWPGAHLTVAAVADQVKGRGQIAWDAASRACELAPLDADAHAMMGSVALSWKRFDVAERALLEALRLDPQHTEARHDLGVVRFNSGSYGEAAAGFVSSLKDDPNLGVARQNLEGVVLRWVQRTHLGMWGVWWLVRLFVAGEVQLGAVAVWLLGVVLLAWWTRRTVSTLAGDLRVVLWRVLRSSWLASLWFGCVVLAAVGTTVAALVPVLAVAVASLVVAGLALLVGCLASWVRFGWTRARG